MNELNNLLSFSWQGSKKKRWTSDKWGEDKNCRRLMDSKTTANALLTGNRQLNSTKQWKLIAVDLDHKDNWSEVIKKYIELDLPQTLTVATPNGGYHLFFWIQEHIPAQSINDDRHCKNFELKGDMSNITAPGSVFECGATYKVIRDIPIARLRAGQAYRLCKRKKEWHPPKVADDFIPDKADVESHAFHLDPRARKNPRGWQVRCPVHEDRRSSAVLFDSGWIYCSGCGHKEQLVKKEFIK